MMSDIRLMPVPYRLLRRTTLFTLLTTLLALLLGASLITPAKASRPLPGVTDTRRVADDFAAFVEHNLLPRAPGVALAVVGPEDAQLRTWGVRRLGAEEAVDPHTTFRLASLSKAFAAATAGVLVQEGSLQWDDGLNDYLAGLRLKDARRQQAITVRHILSNSTGLMPHSYTNLIEANVPYPRILQQLDKVDFVCDPGKCYTYQNVVYSLIGDILSQVTGKDYVSLVEEKVLDPLGMSDASATLEDFIGNPNHALPHERRRKRLQVASVEPNYYSVAPAAGINASITDMAQWLRALLGQRPEVLGPALLTELFRPHATVRDGAYRRAPWRQVDIAAYGLGWRVLEVAGTSVAFHAGWVQGFHAEIVVIPSLGLGMALLMNSDHTGGLLAAPHFLEMSLPGLGEGQLAEN